MSLIAFERWTREGGLTVSLHELAGGIGCYGEIVTFLGN